MTSKNGRLYAGLDIGSRTTKAVVMDGEGRIRGTRIEDSKYSSGRIGALVFEGLLAELGISRGDVSYLVATGYGRVSVPWADATVTEITCHARGAHSLNPTARSVIDIGGQDSKAISLTETGGVMRFAMNDKCAAGCGRFLETILKHALDTSVYELDSFHIDLRRACPINSTCTVFAESEVISLLAEGTEREAIIGGLVNAIAHRVSSLLKRIGIREEVVFCGGVAKNRWVRAALEEALAVQIKSVDGMDPQLVGALGAALLASERSQCEPQREPALRDSYSI